MASRPRRWDFGIWYKVPNGWEGKQHKEVQKEDLKEQSSGQGSFLLTFKDGTAAIILIRANVCSVFYSQLAFMFLISLNFDKHRCEIERNYYYNFTDGETESQSD